MSKFWHTVKELEPPEGKNVWTTENPFISAPKIRLNSWDGFKWRYGYEDSTYWAFPINKKADNKV